MLELIFQGFMEWAYGLTLECWEYFSSSLLSIMSMDYAYMKSHVPVMVSITQVLLAVGWALLIGNLVFQALKSMAVGLGFEGEDPKLLFTRTFVFAFLLMASPQICEVGLSLTARIIELLEMHHPPSLNRHAVQVDAQRIIPHPPKGLSSVHGLTGASHRAAMFLLIKHGSPITARHGRKRDRLGFEMSLRQKECFPLSVPTPQEIERMSLKGR